MSKKILKIGATVAGFAAGGPIGAAAAYGATSAATGLMKKKKAAGAADGQPIIAPLSENPELERRALRGRRTGAAGRSSTILGTPGSLSGTLGG
ncbi:hypothetical protein GG804_25020 [Sphingomonas histidinilytica]|uniref:hypothetical protein n=1 Tax=Rhizorhabdus histidinilytica TaxID=439228 RepID=UPI001AD9F8FF|nr:hypothetical protein [Rhizorhabdus histidinilytica]MBO9380034.1 hypothetical protein [Rhizorhabdus histidinilytica]